MHDGDVRVIALQTLVHLHEFHLLILNSHITSLEAIFSRIFCGQLHHGAVCTIFVPTAYLLLFCKVENFSKDVEVRLSADEVGNSQNVQCALNIHQNNLMKNFLFFE